MMSVGMSLVLNFLLQPQSNRAEIKWLKDSGEEFNLWSKVKL